MKLSIIIPLYNKQDVIARAMLSVVYQMGPQHELIVIDDGSTDQSLEYANVVAARHSSLNILIRSQKNAGVSAARNAGTRYARGHYLCFLDADDLYDPTFLDEVTKLIKQFPEAALMGTGYRFVDNNNGRERSANIAGLKLGLRRQKLKDFFASASQGDLPITSSSACIKTSALKSIGGFPENEQMGEDQSVWSQLALLYSVAMSTKICSNYFVEVSDSIMKSVAPSTEMPFSKRLNRQLINGEIPAQLTESVGQYMAGHLLDLVRRNLLAGNIKNARKLLSDRRTRLQRKRWLYWFMRTRLGR